MLTLAPIRTPERVADHFAPAHRHGGAARPATWFGKGAALEGLRDPVDPTGLLPLLAALVARARQCGKAPAAAILAAITAASTASPRTRATGC